MATDVAAVKAKIQQERDLVASMLALIDIPFEKSQIDQAQAALDAAQRAFDKRSQRWTLINEKVDRLPVLDAQIALFSP
jgi:hypothetical protein